MTALVTPTTLRRKLRYRPGDRGERNPITAAHVAIAVEYRSLGLSWATCAALLRLDKTRLRVAVRASPANGIGGAGRGP